MTYYGDFPTSHTAVCMPFDTFAASTGAPTATTNFANTDIVIFKDGGTTQRTSANGIVVSTSFDSNTGLQMVTIDLSDNTDAGFYAAGHEFQVAVADITADGQTLRFWLGCFSIERAGGVLALIKGNAIKVDVNTIKTNPVVNGGTVTFPTTATLASTTNITAGTITTVTNLTNAPTAGDFTATMKAATLARVTLVDTLTTYTGNTPQTGDCYPKVDTEVATLVTGVADIQTRIPAALTSNGNMKSSMMEILTTALTETAGQIAAGFKKFFNIATPAATMDHGILVDTVTTYTGNTKQTGDSYALLGTPDTGTVSEDIAGIDHILNVSGAVVSSITAAAQNALADAIMLRTLGVQSYAAVGAVPTFGQAIFMILQNSCEFSITGTTLTVKKLDGTTAMTFTLDSATAATSRTRAT